MNENQIQEIIRNHGNALPGAPLESRPKRRHPARWGLVAATAIAVAAVVFVATSPSAEARPGVAVSLALKDVRSMYARTDVGVATSELWMENGVWSTEVRRPVGMHNKLFVITQDLQFMSDLDRKVTTVEPRNGEWYKARTALDYVVEFTDIGVMGLERKLTRTEGPNVAGRPTYLLTYFKASPGDAAENSTAKILVDAGTNLPIWSETTVNDPDGTDQNVWTDYEFNIPVPEGQFEPRFQPVIDLDTAQKELIRKWDRTAAAAEDGVRVLDAQVNADGDLFVLFTGERVPLSAVDASGRKYVYAADYRPGGTWGDTGTQKRCVIDGDDIRGTILVPANGPIEPASGFTVSFGTREYRNPGFSRDENPPTPKEFFSREMPAISCEDWPDYRCSMLLADFFQNMWPIMALAQGKALGSAGEIDAALKQYEVAFIRGQEFLPSVAYRNLEPAAELLRKAGRDEEAKKMQARIDAMKAVDPNRPKRPQP